MHVQTILTFSKKVKLKKNFSSHADLFYQMSSYAVN